MVPRLAFAPTPGAARGAALGPVTGPQGALPTVGASGFAEEPRARGPPAATLRPLLPLLGSLGAPTPLAGLLLQAGVGPGVGLVGGTPSRGTARASRPGASLALLLPWARPSQRSRDPWVAGRHPVSALPVRAFRLDVTLGMGWSARPPGLASPSPRRKAAAPGRARLPACGEDSPGPGLCSRLDLRTGGAGGATPPGLAQKPPLGAALFLLMGVALGLPRQAAASPGASPKDAEGVLTPSVVAPLRRGGIGVTTSGLWATRPTSQPSTTLRAQASVGAGLGALPPEARGGGPQSSARSSQGSSKRPPGPGGPAARRGPPTRPAAEVVLGVRGRLEWRVCAGAGPRGDTADCSRAGRPGAATASSAGQGPRAGPRLSSLPPSER